MLVVERVDWVNWDVFIASALHKGCNDPLVWSMCTGSAPHPGWGKQIKWSATLNLPNVHTSACLLAEMHNPFTIFHVQWWRLICFKNWILSHLISWFCFLSCTWAYLKNRCFPCCTLFSHCGALQALDQLHNEQAATAQTRYNYQFLESTYAHAKQE